MKWMEKELASLQDASLERCLRDSAPALNFLVIR